MTTETTSARPTGGNSVTGADLDAAPLRLSDVMDDDLLAIPDMLDRIAATLRRRDRRRAEAQMLTVLAGRFAQRVAKDGMTAVDIGKALEKRGVQSASEATVRRLLDLAAGRKPVKKQAATGLRQDDWTDAT